MTTVHRNAAAMNSAYQALKNELSGVKERRSAIEEQITILQGDASALQAIEQQLTHSLEVLERVGKQREAAEYASQYQYSSRVN